MKTTLVFLLHAIEYIFNFTVDILQTLFILFSSNKSFDSQFGNESSISSVFNTGFVVFKHKRLTRKASFQNVMISGPTGSGKTVKLIAKNLFELKRCSIILTDPSKELFTLCSGYLSQYFKIISLNFTDSLTSCGYNFLSRIRKQNDVNKLVNVLVSATLDKSGSSDPYWSLSTKSMLSIFIRLVLYQSECYRNMANVLHVLNTFASKPKIVDQWIVSTCDKDLLSSYMALVATPEKTLQNIVSSAKAAMSPFEDPEIAKTTSCDSFKLDSIRQKPTIIFIHSSISDQKYISTLSGMYFEQLFSNFLEKIPDKKELDVFLILEECSSLFIPLLPLALANLRKHRVGSMLCLQQGNTQLKKMYGDSDADNIISNCISKIYLPGITEMQTLQMIETLSGKTMRKNRNGVEQMKSLVTAEEARILPSNRCLLLHGNKPIIKGRLSPYYKSLRYRSYAQIPPIPLVGDIPDEPISLMQ